MEIKQISKRLVIAGSLLILSIKLIIRPFYLSDDPARFFLGIAPNLFGSFLIPFAAYWLFNGKDFSIARIFKIQSLYDLRAVCLIGLGLLIINEYLQLIPFFGRTFDYFDIFFSAVGLATAYFVLRKIYPHEKRSYEVKTN
jgi:hypothetical protein